MLLFLCSLQAGFEQDYFLWQSYLEIYTRLALFLWNSKWSIRNNKYENTSGTIIYTAAFPDTVHFLYSFMRRQSGHDENIEIQSHSG